MKILTIYIYINVCNLTMKGNSMTDEEYKKRCNPNEFTKEQLEELDRAAEIEDKIIRERRRNQPLQVTPEMKKLMKSVKAK